jgi:hypothetical protein
MAAQDAAFFSLPEAAMQFQFDVSTAQQPKPTPAAAPTGPEGVGQLLRQLLELQREGFTQTLEVQREHLAHAKQVHQENLQRWKNLMARWNKEFPDLAGDCKRVYPHLERAYLNLVNALVQDLLEQGEEGFESDFALQDFIDRHGMRVGQLAHLLSVIGPLSEAAAEQKETPSSGA